MKTVLIFSGGMDSTTLLYWLKFLGRDVSCLGINYGQRHGKELAAAEQIALEAGVDFKVADLSGLKALLGGSSQTDDSVPVPEGHYAEESMKKTVVPNRNMIMLSVVAGHAISLGAQSVAYAAHSGDHAIYPDCRPEFADAMDRALGLCDWSKVSLERPFVGMSKADIARLGGLLNVPFRKTWSCYKGGERHCARCGTCVERILSFHEAKIEDPTEYETDKTYALAQGTLPLS